MAKKINTIIVDDETGCINNLQYYISKFCPDIKVVSSGNNLADVLHQAGTQHIDLAFLDIELFDDDIFSALHVTPHADFKTVFVTAHPQYALKAIKIEALDYILKPLCEEDIIKCYLKTQRHFMPRHTTQNSDATDNNITNKKIILKNAEKLYIIKHDDIYYMCGNGPYTDITFLYNGEIRSITICKVLNKLEEEYDNPSFFRVHKSYIVNVNKIAGIVKDTQLSIQMTDKKTIPVSKRKASDFLYSLNNGI